MSNFGLDPILLAATDPYGSPRFFPPGSHPAFWRERQQLRKAEEMIAKAERLERETLTPVPRDELEEFASYVRERLAISEEQESRAKQDYLARFTV